MTQQMTKVNFQVLTQSYIHDYLTGQYILFDFGTELLLPVYVLNGKCIRAQRHIIHIHDLQNYCQTELKKGDFIHRDNIQLEYNYVELTSQPPIH